MGNVKVYCEGTYIGVVLRSFVMDSRDDGEISGNCRSLRINLLKSEDVFTTNPFNQTKPVDFIIDSTDPFNQTTVDLKIKGVLFFNQTVWITDNYLLFDYVEWVAEESNSS